MRTRLSNAFDEKVSTYYVSTDGSDNQLFLFVRQIWARVEDASFESYDVIGQSTKLYDKKVICRRSDLDPNTNMFAFDNILYQINEVKVNHRKTQFTYYITATNFTTNA